MDNSVFVTDAATGESRRLTPRTTDDAAPRPEACIFSPDGDRIAYVPFFPLGGFTPLQSSTLSAVAQDRGATPMQVALAWLLRRSPNVVLIPGTASLAHLRENLAAAELDLPDEALVKLDGVAQRHA